MARIIAFGPHPDDQELGMGGTIALLAAQGHDVLIVDLTNGEPTPHGSLEARTRETRDATRVLSPDPDRPIPRVCLGLPNRSVTHTIEARRTVAAAIRAWQADVLFTTHPEDAHPDHVAGTRIVDDARFDAKLTKIEMPPPTDRWTGEPMAGPGVEPGGRQTTPIYPTWVFYYYATHLRRVADPGFVVDISAQLTRKIDAINAYETQFVRPEKNRAVVEWVRAAAVYFGSRIGSAAGEPFSTREPLGLTGFASIRGLEIDRT